MKNYLPRFTLRRALIAIALLALFLGWLRPHKARVYRREMLDALSMTQYQATGSPMTPVASVTHTVVFSPIWPNRTIAIERTRQVRTGKVTYSVDIQLGF